MRSIAGTLCAVVLIACANEKTIDITGKIYVKGNEPFSGLVIEDIKDHQSYKITNAKRFDLLHKQQQTVRIKAKRVKKALGPGFPAEIEVIEIVTGNK